MCFSREQAQPIRTTGTSCLLPTTRSACFVDIRVLVTLVVVLLPSSVLAEDEAIAKLFAQSGLDGTLVVSSLRTGQTFIHNDERASRRFSPASMFKIFNTLIAVDTGAIAGPDAVLKWDGQVRQFTAWNRDQTLASAFQVSCVWCYQELATRVGPEKYREAIHLAAYGERHEPFPVTEFWLDGSLQCALAG